MTKTNVHNKYYSINWLPSALDTVMLNNGSDGPEYYKVIITMNHLAKIFPVELFYHSNLSGMQDTTL